MKRFLSIITVEDCGVRNHPGTEQDQRYNTEVKQIEEHRMMMSFPEPHEPRRHTGFGQQGYNRENRSNTDTIINEIT